MARAASLFFALGGCFGLLSLALPDTSVDDETLLFAVSAGSLAVALVVIAIYDRMPRAGFHVVVAIGSVAASLAIYAWGWGSSFGPLPYAWVMLFAFYFFTLPAALVHLAIASAGFAAALIGESPPGNHFDGWVATTGTLLAGGLFVVVVRDRMTSMITTLADAAHRDSLTDLLNRRGFEEMFDLELQRARRAEAPLSLIVGDPTASSA